MRKLQTMTAEQVEKHREHVMRELGITEDDLTLVMSRYRGGVTAIRERLVVGLRDTPTESGSTMSWPCVAEAIGLPRRSHASPHTTYHRVKARV